MDTMVKALEELAQALSRLPTIGKKTAWRLAMHLLERDREELRHLADCIAGIKDRVNVCSSCFNLSETPVCPVCSSPSRDASIICVVEKPTDAFTIEQSGRFRGRYHVLGGVLSPIEGVTADKLRIAELEKRIETEKPREIILGLGASAEAETTALYIAKIFSRRGVRVTRLARGLPAGMELEYVDQLTLTQALNERTDIRYE
jgi:recombination protein RecR